MTLLPDGSYTRTEPKDRPFRGGVIRDQPAPILALYFAARSLGLTVGRKRRRWVEVRQMELPK